MNIKLTESSGLSLMQKSAVARGDVQWQLVKDQGWQCCLNCEEFKKDTSVCMKHGNQTPPPQVILLGCKDHMCDIPF